MERQFRMIGSRFLGTTGKRIKRWFGPGIRLRTKVALSVMALVVLVAFVYGGVFGFSEGREEGRGDQWLGDQLSRWVPFKRRNLCDTVQSFDHSLIVQLPFCEFKRPVVDFRKKLFVCVTPKAGITKIENLFMEDFRSYTPGNRSEIHVLNRKVFASQFAKNHMQYAQDSFHKPGFVAMNHTKMFVYRNPVDRFLSLWFDKFRNPEQTRWSWVSMAYYNSERKLDLDDFLHDLKKWVLHPGTVRDPHVWPQLAYCEYSNMQYDAEVDIDDHAGLVKVLGPFWAVKPETVETSTRHATKSRRNRDALKAALDLLWKHREQFVSVYYADIEYYCRRNNQKLLVEFREKP